MKLFFTIIFSILLFLNNRVNAVGINACDMSYQATANKNIYKVTVKVYRDCSGTQLCSGCNNAIPNGTVDGCTLKNAGFSTAIIGADNGFEGIVYGEFDLNTTTTISNGYDIIGFQHCNKVKSICTNCNTRTAGTYSPGIEVYTFDGMVDLSNVPVSCCKVALGISINGRNNGLTTIIPESFYTECVINKCFQNSSPTFTNHAYALICTGLDYIYSLDAIDPDNDSLSYSILPCLKARGVKVNYVSPYNDTFPFPYTNVDMYFNRFPKLLYYDITNKGISFRPLGMFNANILIEVNQWRLINGKQVNIGKTYRDVQFNSLPCQNNRVPIIKVYKEGVLQTNSSIFYTQFEKQICLDLVAQDQEVLSNIPPILADTTDLKWNYPGANNPEMANATFISNYILNERKLNGPKADSFKFCWTPPRSAVRNNPHSFTVTGSDRFCPNKAWATKGINITVGLGSSVKVSSIQNINFVVYPNPVKDKLMVKLNFIKESTFEISIIDVLGNEVFREQELKINDQNEIELAINSLNKGIYFIRIYSTTESFAMKFIKD